MNAFKLSIIALKDMLRERKVYLLVLVASAVVSAVTVLNESGEERDAGELKRRGRILEDGWRLLSRKQDLADFEWSFWFSNLRESILVALTGHVIISYFSEMLVPWAKEVILTMYCANLARVALGEAVVALIIFVCVFFYAMSSVVAKSSIWCWCITVASILILHFDSFYMKVIPTMTHASYATLLAYSSLGFTVLRCCSFCLERIRDCSINAEKKYQFLKLIQYNFYLPYFFFGPVMTYNVFVGKVQSLPSKNVLAKFLRNSLKIMSSVAIIDLLLHFVHFSSIAVDSEFLQSAPVHVIGFLLFCNVFLDWMKVYVLYGITTTVANIVDGYSDAPEGPKCVATICTFADTYFDRGIQHWLCRYIYDPIGEDHKSISKETFASVVTFLFVAMWQGPGLQVMTWAILNCLGLTFEFFISKMTPAEDKTNKRLVAVFLGLNYWCILLFNTVGINGMQSARISAKSAFFSGDMWNFMLTVLLGYCYAGFITISSPKTKRQ